MSGAAGLAVVLSPDGGTVGLAGLRFLEPSHLVGVAALAHAAHRDGRPFALLPPALEGTARFACRMRVGQALARLGFDDPLGSVRERPLASELLEVSALGPDGITAAALAELVSEKVRHRNGPAVAQALFQSTSEIGENAETYAGITGYAAAVTVPRNRELLVAVADAGVGLAGTLGRGLPLSDAEALRLALKGVSSRPNSRSGGSGIRMTLHAVTALGGRCVLLSGDSAVSVGGAGAGSPFRLPRPFPGTLFQARIPLD